MSDEIVNVDRFSEIKIELEKLIEDSACRAQEIIDEYYNWWTNQNKEVLNLRSLGESVKTGDIAPFIKLHPTNVKYYITWVTWPRLSIENRIKQRKIFAVPINPWKRGYTKELLTSKCENWELQRVLETEDKLSSSLLNTN